MTDERTTGEPDARWEWRSTISGEQMDAIGCRRGYGLCLGPRVEIMTEHAEIDHRPYFDVQIYVPLEASTFHAIMDALQQIVEDANA